MLNIKDGFDKDFEQIKAGLKQAHNRITERLAGPKDGPNDPFPGYSPWDVLYGFQSRQALLKIQEAMFWIEDARLSIG